MWPGPSIITCTPWALAILVSSPSVRSSANCASSLASAIDPGRKPSPREKVTSQLRKMAVKERLGMVCEAPGRHDRAAPRHDAGDSVDGQRGVTQQDAGVHRHVVH